MTPLPPGPWPWMSLWSTSGAAPRSERVLPPIAVSQSINVLHDVVSLLPREHTPLHVLAARPAGGGKHACWRARGSSEVALNLHGSRCAVCP